MEKFLIVLMLLWVQCGKEPNYSVVPEIALVPNGLTFIDAPTPGDSDTLRISLRFTDGDGDLGLDSNSDNKGDYTEMFYTIYFTDYTTDKLDSNPYKVNTWVSLRNGYPAKTPVKYQKRFWISTVDGNVGVPGNSQQWKEFFALNYKAKRTIPEFQSFPEFIKPYNCTKWDTVHNKIDNINVTDTLSIEYNPNHYNIFIDIYTKNPDGTFSLFDPTTYYIYPNCLLNPFNGRFPILTTDSNNPNPLNGVLNYSLYTAALTLLFGNKTLKLKTHIVDRSKHKSNVVETPEFTLQSIKR